MSKAEILEHFNDINYAYNNSSKHDTLENMLDEMEEEIRNKAIDEFVKRIKKYQFHSTERFENCVAIANIDWLAEQMKGE